MSRLDDLDRVLVGGVVAILRMTHSERLVQIAEALYEGGIDVIEVTLTVPNALQIIEETQRRLGDKILLGAGSVLDAETGRMALLAGARFLVSPVTRVSIIEMAHRYDAVVMPGAYTPTEVLTAWEAGADVVKIFPAESGGPKHLKALKGPLPQVRMMPTGGVNLETMEEFAKAGACAVGAGSALLDKDAIVKGNFDRLAEIAAEYITKWQSIQDRLRSRS